MNTAMNETYYEYRIWLEDQKLFLSDDDRNEFVFNTEEEAIGHLTWEYRYSWEYGSTNSHEYVERSWKIVRAAVTRVEDPDYRCDLSDRFAEIKAECDNREQKTRESLAKQEYQQYLALKKKYEG